MTPIDRVVLLDDDARPIGTTAKADVHGPATPLHLAFSCHVLNADGDVLVTRRALGKATWPGVWTNSFCGHPRPDEPLPQAVRRHARHELGLDLAAGDIDLALPDFRYRAVDASGVVENEVCPVYLVRVDAAPAPNPDEVAEHRWISPADLATAVTATPFAFSPWLVLQVPLLPMYDRDTVLEGRT